MPDESRNIGSGNLFLSYHRSDGEAVLAVQRLLRSRGIGTFLDRDQLVAGMPWPQALEQALRDARAVAVFIGPGGLGLWQKREMGYALDRQVQEEGAGRPFPVIPVLLPGADITAGFLFLNTWVDLRGDLADSEALALLARGVEGGAAAAPLRELEPLCPYRGLHPFREEDAAFFLGREAFSQRLLEAILGRNLVAVVGTSGSGKSSVVQAGVLPLLRRQRPPETTWDSVTFVPGARPFHRLAGALIPLLEPDLPETDRLAEAQKLGELLARGEVTTESVVDRILGKSGGTDRLLVVADQFEELFTLTAEPERQAFLALLLRALDRSPALTLVMTIRGTFYDSLISASRDLSDRLEQAVVNLGTMTRDELHRAVVEPAKRVGLDFEPGLVKRILDDVGDEPGNLPLLEFALAELWSRRQGKLMTHGAYEEIGGVSGAMAQRADAVFAALSPVQQERAHRLLTRLVRVGDQAEMALATRQRARVSELGEESRDVLRLMADARLLVVGKLGAAGEETAEVAHEALIRHWKRLQEWLDQDREFLLWRRRLQTALTEWERTGRDEGALLRGTPLREAERWHTGRVGDLSPHEQEFITGSSALDTKERTLRERRRKIILAASLGSATVLLVLCSLALVQSLEAFSRELAARARAQLTQDPELSLLLATEAVNVKETDEAVDVLRQSLMESRVRLTIAEKDVVTDAAFSPDGMRVVTGTDDGAARIWDISRGKPTLVRELTGHTAPVTGVVFNSDGSLIVTTSADRTARVWDAITGESRTELRGHSATVNWGSFSPDGAFVVTASDDKTARVWDARTGRLLRVLRGHGAPVATAAFSPDGRTIVTASLDGSAWVWSAATGRKIAVLRGHQAPLTDAVFSPDGATIVTASDDNTARVWRREKGQWRTVRQLVGHADSLTSAAFSPDGRLLVTSSRDRTARVWDARTGLTLSELKGHFDVVTNAAFSPDGKRIITGSRDTTARLWEALNEHGRQALHGHAGTVDSAEVSRDGRLVVTASSDNTARLWDVATGATLRELAGHTDSLNGAAFSPDGTLVVTASDDNTARIWSVESGKTLHRLDGHTDIVRMAAFSPDGRLVVTASNDRSARVWDAATGKPVSTLGGGSGGVHALTGQILRSGIAFSPDGKTIVTTLADGTTFVWDAATGRLLRQTAVNRHGTGEGHSERIYTARFSPDGMLTVTASADGTARVWTARTGQPLAVLRGHGKGVVDAVFSPDGAAVVTASKDGTAGVWEAKSGRLLHRLQGHSDELTGAAFSADGRWIITAGKDAAARVWDAGTGRTVAVLTGHRDWVTGAEFSPDARLAVTASRDRTALVWERPGEGAWRVKARLFGHSLGVRAHFSPDGSSVVTASRDGTARVWRLNEPALPSGGMKPPKASPVADCEICWPSSDEIRTLAAERGAHASPQMVRLVRERFLRSHDIRYRVLAWLGGLWGRKL